MIVNCAVCAAPFEKKGKRTRRRYCSARCRKRMQNAREWGREPNLPTSEVRTCECGAEFTPARVTQRYCDGRCRGRLYAARRRAGGDSILLVWKRAKAACFVCGLPTDLSVRWPNDEAPTLEHVIPISRGGGNDAYNVTISHWRCNREKGVA